jgi:hypothetical protein
VSNVITFRLRALYKRILFILTAALLVCGSQAVAQAPQQYALLIGGLGGSEEHASRFQSYLFETHRALVQGGIPAGNVIVLAGTEGADFANGLSGAENIQAQFQALAARVRPSDTVLIILYGHGNYDGEHAFLNIPRRDLSDNDFAALVASLPSERVVFINTSSSSAPFAEKLSGPGRIVITATRTGTQRNDTVFPQYLVEALAEGGDLDKDGNLSVGELFTYAAENTARHFEENGNIPTENAMLEDTGDAQAVRLEEMETSGEGNLAAVTFIRRQDATLAQVNAPPGSPLAQAIGQRQQLEQSIAEMKAQKAGMSEDAYYGQLETLFVRLARLNDQIDTTAQ